MRIASSIIPILAALLLTAPALAQGGEEAVYGDEYQTGDYARIRFEENGVTIIRGESDRSASFERETGTVNAPVFPGDTIETGRDQRVEVQLAGGSLVRLDRDTELTFLSLPAPYSAFQDNVVLQLVAGAIRVTARVSDDQEFRVDTPSSSVYLLGDGDFRIEADPRGRSLIHSWRGVAEVAGAGGSVLVRAGMRTEAYPGELPLDPESFNTFVADRFDRWVQQREELYRTRDHYGYSGYDTGNAELPDDEVYEALPYEVQPYYGELSRSGRWVFVADYGYVWYPVDVRVGWRPYSNGYWSYGPRGYFWVSYDPWGWAPHHYGRWSYIGSYGWCWVPGRIFSGAWVSWSWGSAYIGWSPLDYWNRPAYYGSYYYGYYDPRCWTFISYNHIHYRNYHHYTVDVRHIGDGLRRSAVVTRAPRVSPRELVENPESRTRAVLEARRDTRARIAPIERTRAGTRRFLEVEQERIPGAARRTAARSSRAAGPTADRVRGPKIDRAAPGLRDRAVRERPAPEAGRSGEAATRYPRRIPARSDAAQRAPARATQRDRSEAAPGRRAEPDRVKRPVERVPSRLRGVREPTQDRLRDLYRKMARPPQSRARDEAGPAPRAPERPRSSTPAPRARPQAPQRDDRPREVDRPRSSGDRPKPRAVNPQRNRPQPRKVDRPRSSGNQPQPGAVSPQRSRPQPRTVDRPRSSGNRPQPRATSSAPRPSKPTPRAAASRGSRPQPKAKAPRSKPKRSSDGKRSRGD